MSTRSIIAEVYVEGQPDESISHVAFMLTEVNKTYIESMVTKHLAPVLSLDNFKFDECIFYRHYDTVWGDNKAEDLNSKLYPRVVESISYFKPSDLRLETFRIHFGKTGFRLSCYEKYESEYGNRLFTTEEIPYKLIIDV